MTRRTGGRWKRPLSVVVGLAIAAPFYWLLVDTTSSPELIAGAVAALIAAVAYSAAHLEPTESATAPANWPAVVVRELAKVPSGIVVVCAEVLRQAVAPRKPRGVLEEEPFFAGRGRPHDLGRRALAEAARSFAPNTIVIGVDPDHDRLLIHRLGPRR